MFRKLLIRGLVALFILSFLPLTASANTNAIQPGTLIKGSSQSVYYYGADGKRYVFPNENTYKTWFINYNVVVSISDQTLGNIQIGGNVTYKPGKKMVKIMTDPKVYYVDTNGTLRHITSEQLAKTLYGDSWSKMVDDVPDAFFINYKVGLPLTDPIVTTVASNYSINEDKLLSEQADPTPADIGQIDLVGVADNQDVVLTWTTQNLTADQGFKIVMSEQAYPVYPGNQYHYLDNSNARSDRWELLLTGTYHFRVCQYTNGACGIYSNDVAVSIVNGPVQTDKMISLTAAMFGDKVILNWTANFTSPQGFKVIKAEHYNPVYPGDDYHYLTDPYVTTDTWYDLPMGSWNFRVCEYMDGTCGTYSNNVGAQVALTTNDSNITLSGNIINGTANLSWTTTDLNSDKGFKIVMANHINPIYPGDDYHYYTDPNLRNDAWNDLSSGIYHFRVCQYLGGSCGIYSNNLTLTVQ